ncbi:class I adenylate-forming enzyme family protein [Micromonospora sp. PTRAS2]
MTTSITRSTLEASPTGDLGSLLRRAALRHGSRDAVVTSDVRMTYRELDTAADRAAAAFTTAPGTTVGLMPLLDPRFAVAYFGALRAGRTVVALSPFLTGESLAHQLTAAEIGLAVLDQRLYDLAPPGAPVISYATGACTWADFLASAPIGSPAPAAPQPGAAAYIHFTSGTTGTPKGVVMSHANLLANAAQTADAHELGTFGRVLNHLPLFHFMHLGAAVHAGATQTLAPGRDTVAAFELAEECGAQIFYALPAQLARLARDPRVLRLRARSVQVVRTGGTALDPEVATVLSAQLGVPVLQGYGMAETSALTHSGIRARPVPESVGPPVAGTECRIVDLEMGEPLPPGVRGEVQVRGPQVTSGYWHGTPPGRAGVDGWLATGDTGLQDQDGLLYLKDRVDDLFKTGNQLVAPADVEAVFRAHPGVGNCVVVPFPDEILGHVPALVVVPTAGSGNTAALAIATEVNAQLGEPLRVRRVAVVAEIPGSDFGKIRRREIGRRLHEDPGSSQPVPPAI